MKIIVTGNYGAKNIGDEMILEGLIETIKNTFPKSEVTVLSGDPKETSQKFKLESVKKIPSGVRSYINYLTDTSKETKKAIKDCDLFILGGGGLFGSLKVKANFIWGVQCLAAYHYKKPVIMYGQGIGPISNIASRVLLKKVFNKAHYITVRDFESVMRLRDIGVRKPIDIVPDLAFRLPAKKSKKKRTKTAVIALRQMSKIDFDFKLSIAKYIDWLIESEKFKVKLIDFKRGDKHDSALHEEVMKLTSNSEKVEHITNVEHHEELLEHFQQAQIVLGMRLHSIISAIRTETPFFAINYAPKVSSFLKYSKLSSQMLQVYDLDLETLQKAHKSTLKKKASLTKKLSSINKKYLKQHEKIEDKMRKKFLS